MTTDLSKLKIIGFDWDEGNKYKNWEKHRVNFHECEEVFFNKPIVLLHDKKHSQKEERFITLGITNSKRRLIVSFTIRNNKIRIISARSQSQKERKIYG